MKAADARVHAVGLQHVHDFSYGRSVVLCARGSGARGVHDKTRGELGCGRRLKIQNELKSANEFLWC